MVSAFLIPLNDLIVRDPRSHVPLIKGGELKPMIGPEGRYWRRRIKDGTVSIGKPKEVNKSSVVVPVEKPRSATGKEK